MYDSTLLQNPGKRITDLESKTAQVQTQAAQLLSGMVYAYEVTSGANGLVTLDYSALKLTKAPRIGFGERLANQADVPLFVNVLGTPTKDSAVIQVRRITSILSLGLVPQYTGVTGMPVDVYVRAVA